MFPSRLKEVRREKKLSQAELGRRVHVSQQAIAQWESGATSPAPETLALIADILDVSADYLLGKDDKKKPATIPDSRPAGLDVLDDIYVTLSQQDREALLRIARGLAGDGLPK